MSDQNICWRRAWIRPYESFGSMLCKFAFLNSVKVKDLIQFLGDDEDRKFPGRWTTDSRSSLSWFGCFSVEKLCRAFQTNSADLEQAIVSLYVREGREELSRDLRVCPRCLLIGFHSSIHQILLIKNCPIHAVPLTAVCSHCKTRNASYTLHSLLEPRDSPCNCPLRALERVPAKSGIPAQLQSKANGLAITARWLTCREELAVTERPLEEWLNANRLVLKWNSSKWKARQVDRLRSYWIDLLNEEPPHNSSRRLSREAHVVIRKPHRGTSTPSDDHQNFILIERDDRESDAFDLTLMKIFKSIRRHLKKRELLVRHRRCIKSIQQRVNWTNLLFCRRGKLCPHANAFLWWLMSWFEIADPGDLDRKYNAKWQIRRTSPRVRWERPTNSLPPTIVQHLFAMECLTRYRECFLRSIALRRLNRYSLCIQHLCNRRMPYWVVDVKADCTLLHMWPRLAIGFEKDQKALNRNVECDNSVLEFWQTFWPEFDLKIRPTTLSRANIASGARTALDTR